MEAPATAQLEHGPDFSPQHEFYRSFQSLLRNFSGGIGADGHPGARSLTVFHAAEYFSRAAGAVQPQASRGRRRHRLPLLSYFGRKVRDGRYPSDENVHELPFGFVQQRRISGAGARKLSNGRVDSVGESAPPRRFRLFQPQYSHQQGRRLFDLPRRGKPDAAYFPGEHAVDAVVPRLPSQSGDGAAREAG